MRWRDGEITVVEEGLVSPTSVAVADGRIFVSEEFAGRVSEIPLDDPGPGQWAWAWALVVGGSAAVLVHVAAGSWLRRRSAAADPAGHTRPES